VKFVADEPSQETCPNVVAAFERPRKGVQAAGNSFSEEDPVASLSPFARQRGDGILRFENNLECADLSALFIRLDQKRRQVAVLQIFVAALALLLTSWSCTRAPHSPAINTTETREVTDEAGRRVRLPLKIDRIVSLAPNLTEIVYAVGAGDRLVGDTEYCDYPAAAKSVAKVGDTVHPSIERIIALKPQVVLVSTASQLEAFTKQLDDQQIAVYVTNPQRLEDIYRSINTLGDLLGDRNQTTTLLNDLHRRAEAIEKATTAAKPVKVFYQVSGEPLYTIGREAYLTDLIKRAGGISVTADVPGAFPRFSDEAALAAKPEAIILPTGGSMGSANSEAAGALRKSPAVLNNRVYRINDDHLSRPGPRLVDGLEEMARALHPELFK
jgi:iron complex transport system substrate-binding protein